MKKPLCMPLGALVHIVEDLGMCIDGSCEPFKKSLLLLDDDNVMKMESLKT